MGAHGRHGQIRAHAEQADAQDQHHRPNGKGRQLRPRQVQQRRRRQQINHSRHRQHRHQSLFDLRSQFFQGGRSSFAFLYHKYTKIISEKQNPANPIKRNFL